MCPQTPIAAPVFAPALGLPNPIQYFPEPSPHLPASENEKNAYEQGVKAGKCEVENRRNPYPEDSEQAKAYEHGYLDGQKISFVDMT
jgi:hypothetical protein